MANPDTALLRRVYGLDASLHPAVADMRTPGLHGPVRPMPATHRRLPMTSAAVRFFLARGRLTATTALACEAVTSAAVIRGTTLLIGGGLPGHVSMPTSTASRCGRTATAFAFVDVNRHQSPHAPLPLLSLVALGGRCGVQRGVRYPGDVAADAGIGLPHAKVATRDVPLPVPVRTGIPVVGSGDHHG